MVGKVGGAFLLRCRQGHPTLQPMDRFAVFAVVGRRALGMNDAATRGHPIDLAWPDRRGGAEAVAMHDLAVEQERDGGEADMGMRPHIDTLAGAKFRRSEMVEEDERADHAPIHVGQGATHREMAYVHAPRHDHEVDRIGGPRIAGRRVLGRKEAHRISLRCSPQPKSSAGHNDSGLD